ncbi:MAG: hypothetical protein HKN14_03185 [Marinicaulis sp.]|nr:hypothetical protein [Marinicaulis sp.]NNE39906.1 hypothetical protein [Marinicaulis sp.]NNL89958.1 hypothetical protein [Marinicaulis sp.]
MSEKPSWVDEWAEYSSVAAVHRTGFIACFVVFASQRGGREIVIALSPVNEWQGQ